MNNPMNLPLTVLLIALPASLTLAQSASSPSAMQRSHEMRRDVVIAGDARQLSVISIQPRDTARQPRIITAPAWRPPTATGSSRESVTLMTDTPHTQRSNRQRFAAFDTVESSNIVLASPQTFETSTTSYRTPQTDYDHFDNPVTRAGYRHVETYDDGWSSYRHSSHSSAYVTGHSGYFHTSRRYHHYHRPTVIVTHGYPSWYCRPVYRPTVIYYHRPCPPPAVVVCPPRHSGFSFFVKF